MNLITSHLFNLFFVWSMIWHEKHMWVNWMCWNFKWWPYIFSWFLIQLRIWRVYIDIARLSIANKGNQKLRKENIPLCQREGTFFWFLEVSVALLGDSDNALSCLAAASWRFFLGGKPFPMMCETHYVLLVMPHLIDSKYCWCFPNVQRIHKIEVLHHNEQLVIPSPINQCLEIKFNLPWEYSPATLSATSIPTSQVTHSISSISFAVSSWLESAFWDDMQYTLDQI